MRYEVEEIPSLRGYTVEWAEAGNYYLSRGNRIYRTADLAPPFELIASAEAPSWKRAVTKIRPAQRLLSFLVTNVLPLANGDIFVTFDKSVGIVRDGRYFQLEGMDRPCRVLRSGCAVDAEGSVFFGEYLANNERGPMKIYRYSPGGDRLEIAHTFAAGSVKHIHGIYFDDRIGAVYCLTGDDESECRILRTFDGFSTIETVGEGDETWRAVSVLFTPDAIFYGTDAEFRENHIYRLDRATGERENIGEVSGTVFYSKKIGDIFSFPPPPRTPRRKRRTSPRFGPSAPKVT